MKPSQRQGWRLWGVCGTRSRIVLDLRGNQKVLLQEGERMQVLPEGTRALGGDGALGDCGELEGSMGIAVPV